MDAITGAALAVTTSAIAYYVLYLVVRKAVAGGILDAEKARRTRQADEPSGSQQNP